MFKNEIWPLQRSQDDVRVADIVRDLAENSCHLFSAPNGQVDIDVAEVRSHGIETSRLESEGELLEHLSIHHSPDGSVSSPVSDPNNTEQSLKVSFFFLEPAYNWSNLPITRDGILKLFADLQVFPEIYRYLKGFGRKNFPRDEAFAGFNSNTTLDSDGQWTSFESCYLLKYVGKREGATPGTNPWSIRHALIYQKTSPKSDCISHLLIRLPDKVKQQLSDCLTSEEMGPVECVNDWTCLHTTCFSSVDDDVRQFINYLDEEVTKVFDRVIMSGVEPTKLNKFDTAHSSTKDFKTLQYLSDQARRIMKAINLNINTMKCLQREVDCLAALKPCASTNIRSIKVLSGNLRKVREEHDFSLRNASAVLERGKATSEQLRDAVSLRNSEMSKLNTEMTNHNTSALLQLADQSGREAHVVKTLAVLALVFVPASYVADFLQMGFVTISQESPLKWSATADLKIYAILAIPLISVTMLIYGCVEIFQRSRERKRVVRDCEV